VAWFLGQSLLFIVVSFALGLLVGYLIWGRQWRKVRTDEAAAGSTDAASPTTVAAAAPTEPPEPAAAAQPTTEPTTEASPEPAPETAHPAEAESAGADSSAEAAGDEVEPVGVGWPATASEESADEAAGQSAVDSGDATVAAAPSTVDDLERIEGVGPKMAAALRAAGISSYEQLASAELNHIEEAIEDAGLRFAPSRLTWSQQARLLADGDEQGFRELTGRLVAGRDVGGKPARVAATEPAPVDIDEVEAALAEPEAADRVPVAAGEGALATGAAPTAVVEAPQPAPDEPAPDEPATEEVAHGEPAAESATEEPAVEELAQEAPATEEVAREEPATGPGTAEVVPDNLRRIEGIGPKMAGALNAAGITTYEQLAASDETALRAAISAAGLRFAPSLVTWARQARLLADGDEAGFADLTRRLVAGRDVGRV
jgi:predicted flap endonuclease-1-like 5' DNA nuclease